MIGLGFLSAVMVAPVNSGPAALPDFVAKATSAIARRDAKFLDDSYAIQLITDHAETKDGAFLIESLSNCTQRRVVGGNNSIYSAQYECATAAPVTDRNRCTSLLISESSIRMLGCMPAIPPIPPSKPERGN